MSFVPRLDKLPKAQQALWPKLKEVPFCFVLYGGTAMALRLGHRTSVDFDFFSSEPVVPSRLREELKFLEGAESLQVAPNTWTVAVPGPQPVKISFFGGLKLGRVMDPEWSDDNVVQVAALIDVSACKMAVVQERAQAKDYLDIWGALQSGLALPEMLGAAQAIYGEQFNPLITLKALNYFEDGDLAGLPTVVKQKLRSSANAVDKIPTYERLEGGLTSNGKNGRN